MVGSSGRSQTDPGACCRGRSATMEVVSAREHPVATAACSSKIRTGKTADCINCAQSTYCSH